METKQDIAAAALEDGDPAVINRALDNIARAKGISGKAQLELRGSLSSPDIGSVFSTLKAIGFPLTTVASSRAHQPVRSWPVEPSAKADRS